LTRYYGISQGLTCRVGEGRLSKNIIDLSVVLNPKTFWLGLRSFAQRWIPPRILCACDGPPMVLTAY
jgi:hypothetical protein